MPTKYLRIVGVGSPFGSDCLGFQAANYLEQQLQEHYPNLNLECELLDRPGAALLEYLKPFDGVLLLIDALAAESGQEDVASYTVDALQQQASLSSHGFGVAETLALGTSLGILHSDITVVGISTEAQEWQSPLLALVDKLLAESRLL